MRRLLVARSVCCLVALTASGALGLLPRAAGAAPYHHPTGVTIHKPARAYQGHTLLKDGENNRIMLIDMEGNELHYWSAPPWGYPHIGHAKPLPGPKVLAFVYDSQLKKKLVELRLNGSVAWSYQNPNWPRLHHDFQRLANGHTMLIAAVSPNRVYPNISPHPYANDVLIEIDRSGQTRWTWSTADHFDQLPFTQEERDKIFEEINYDITHTNALCVLPPNQWEATHPEFTAGNILVSQRATNFLYIIDRSSGDIVWSMRDRSVGQHAVTMIPEPYMGAGNLLLLDNGWMGGVFPQYRPYSRVPEINPVTRDEEWFYDANVNLRPMATFFTPFRGNAQRLPNGNTLITEDEFGRVFEVTPDDEIVWEYINPHYRGPIKDFSNAVGRVYRLDPNWITGGTGPILDNFVW